MPIDPELDANYEALRASRGWDYETLARAVDTDPVLAAHFRSKAETVPTGAPKSRRAPKASEA